MFSLAAGVLSAGFFSAGIFSIAICAGGFDFSMGCAGVGVGEATGFGGVYCSMITGVAIPSVGNLFSFAITLPASNESGSSC